MAEATRDVVMLRTPDSICAHLNQAPTKEASLLGAGFIVAADALIPCEFAPLMLLLVH